LVYSEAIAQDAQPRREIAYPAARKLSADDLPERRSATIS
jgi:hypothetical protein